jgi:hypothetical protein
VIGAAIFLVSRTNTTSRAFACVSGGGAFEYRTIRNDAESARRACTHRSDTVRSWVQSPAISARVSASGVLVAGSHALAAARTSAALFKVTFDRDVSRCGYRLDSAHGSGEAPTSRARVGPPNQLTIEVVGLAQDDVFGVRVSC